ncbi:MAG: ADP-ribosylglycohydrolase family protein [Gemmatimonadaceae bacterium]
MVCMTMIGAIAGDVIGSVYEWRSTKTTDFPLFQPESRFTDDTVLTVATAHAILEKIPYERAYREFGRRYPNAGYGGNFAEWLFAPEPKPYNSWGNGSAMRVSPVGFAFLHVDDVLREAARSAEVTHDHPEGIKGAQATALAICLARDSTKEEIRDELVKRFGYDLHRTVAEIRPTYQFDVSCQGSVPEAIIAFMDSTDLASAIRLAVSLGGDSDTQAAIAGGIAHAYYKEIPKPIVAEVRGRLPAEFLEIIDRFVEQYPAAG